MSRPESPMKLNVSDDDTIKKLKALLIKEKRLNKESGKIINELRIEHDKISNENNLFVGQIQRLSETIGNLGDIEYNKVQEIDELKNISNKLKDENYHLKNNEKNAEAELKEVFFKIKSLCENRDISLNISDLCDNVTILNLSDVILGVIDDCSAATCVQKELQTLLRNGLEVMTVKCNHLEMVIESNDERIRNVIDNEAKLKHVKYELEQKEEQIQRLEELIEDNRNISRALETERDQLQNDLMDLRQRHEEKEGYLIDEYREAQQSLENYRIFTDKQSAEKANEIERLRKCLEEPFLADCLLCRDLDSSFDRLRLAFDVTEVTMSHENVVLAITEKYSAVCRALEEQIVRLCDNESRCHQHVDDIIERVGTVERLLEGQRENDGDSAELIKDMSKKVREMDGTIGLLRNDLDQMSSLTSKNQEQKDELQGCQRQLDEKDEHIAELAAKLDSIISLSTEKESIQSQKDQLASQRQEEITKLIDDLKRNVLEKDGAVFSLQKEMEYVKLYCTDNGEMSDLDDSSSLSEMIKSTILMTKQYKTELHDCKCREEVEVHQHELAMCNKDKCIAELSEKLECSLRKSDELQSRIDQLVEDFNKRILEKEESLNSLRNEVDHVKSIIREIEDLFHLDDSSSLLEMIKMSISSNIQLRDEMQTCKIQESGQREEKLESRSDQSTLQSVEDNTELFEDFKRKILEKNERLDTMEKELNDIKSVKREIEDLFDLDDSSSLLEMMKSSVLTNKQLIDELQTRKIQENEQKDKFEQTIQAKDVHIAVLEEKFISLEGQLTEKEKLQSQSDQSALQSVKENAELFEDFGRKILEKEESLNSLRKELDHVKSINREIDDLFDLDDSSSLLEMIKTSISTNRQLSDDLQTCKTQESGQKEKYEQTIQIKDDYIAELKGKLAEAGKQVNDNDLMNLEMAEIDKTLVNLNNQLTIKSARVTELELVLATKSQTVETVTEQICNAQKQNQLLDERNNKMKQMLVKTKRELTDVRSQAIASQEKEMLHMNEVEQLNAQIEETKVLLSEAINEREKIQERYGSFSKKMDSMTKSREMTISSLRSQLELNLQNRNSLQQEFDLYKVKVQTAFNTKLKSPNMFSNFMTNPANEKSNIEDVSIKSLKKDISELEMTIDDLKMDLREKDDKIVALNSDLDLLRWENEKLSDKHRCVTKETNELSLKMQQINEQLQTDAKLHQISHSESLQKFNTEKERLIVMYQEQIESIRSNYEIDIENLSQRIEEKEMENIKFQEEIWDCREQLKTADNKLGQVKFSGQDNVDKTIWSRQLRTPLEQERQQGEGMEMNNDAENPISSSHHKISPKLFTRPTNYNSTFISLDQLLNSHNDEGQKFNEEMIDSLKTETSSYRRQNEHLTELLYDNEATVARLTEQAVLLKAEIRRLENNEEREHTLDDHASREYLKNVIVKFLHYDTKSDERSQLVPVITTLLSLDSGEKELLTKFSSVSKKKDTADGWSSYFSWANAT